MAQIAFLGLGAMGSRMAARLLAHGHQVKVWNRSARAADELKSKGAQVASTPREAALEAHLVMSMVRDDDASREVWLDRDQGAMQGLAPEAIAVESSTVTPGWIRELAQKLNHRFLEGPVVGSRPQAEEGKLIYLIGGRTEELNEARPMLEQLSIAIHHVGDFGEAAVMKLAVNSFMASQVALLAEIAGMFTKAGVPLDKGLQIIASTPSASPAAQLAAKSMAAGNYAPLFTVDLVRKDLTYATSLAKSQHAEMPVVNAALGTLTKAVDAGFKDEHMTAVLKLFE